MGATIAFVLGWWAYNHWVGLAAGVVFMIVQEIERIGRQVSELHADEAARRRREYDYDAPPTDPNDGAGIMRYYGNREDD